MGTITGLSDLDPVRWPNSHWRSVKVKHLWKQFDKYYISQMLLWHFDMFVIILSCGLKPSEGAYFYLSLKFSLNN